MGGTRFVFICEGAGLDASSHGAEQVWWRLVAANNRILGRSTGVVVGEQACRRRAATLQTRVDEAVPALSTDEVGRWTWTVALDGVEHARCAHAFPRRVDSVHTLALFMTGLRAADPHAGPLRYFTAGRRALRNGRDGAEADCASDRR